MNNFQNSHWLIEQKKKNPSNVFVRDLPKNYTYKEIFILVQQSVTYLRRVGIRKNFHVSILSSNSIDFIILINSLWLIGAIPIPLNSRLKKDEIKKLIKHSDSKFLITTEKVNFRSNDFQLIKFKIADLANLKPVKRFADFNISNLALLMYSSGSTGEPKCVKLTFKNLAASFVSANSKIKHKQKDVWLASLPFYHIGGFSIITRTLLSGCSLAMIQDFKVQDFVRSFKEFNPSLISIVPTMLKNLIDQKIKPWSNLRIAFLGGGPVDQKLLKNALIKNWPIHTVYGSTETSSMVAMANTKNLKQNGISGGQKFKNVQLEILNENGKKCKKNEIGEIVIKSNSVSSGYYKSKSYNSLRDNKYCSNDLGFIDEKRNYHILGRKDDIIISGGENISLLEIENIVNNLNYIKECTTLKVNDDKWGQTYLLFIVSEENKELKLENFLKRKIAKYKMPKKIIQLEKLPKNEMGKIQKQKLLGY